MNMMILENIKESVFKFIDSYTAAILSISFSLATLEVVGKVLAALLTIILMIRGCIHVSKATIERKTAKLEKRIKELELKKLEDGNEKNKEA